MILSFLCINNTGEFSSKQAGSRQSAASSQKSGARNQPRQQAKVSSQEKVICRSGIQPVIH
ncbi:MAG: hypothetical protein AB1847_10570 [bacterium]